MSDLIMTNSRYWYLCINPAHDEACIFLHTGKHVAAADTDARREIIEAHNDALDAEEEDTDA